MLSTLINTYPDMPGEYVFTHGVRRKYIVRFAEGSNVAVLSPDVARIFPDSASFNQALRLPVQIADKSAGKGSTEHEMPRLQNSAG